MELFELLKADKFDKVTFESNLTQLTRLIYQNEENTFLHFRELRDMCNPEQKVRFDNDLIVKLNSQGLNRNGPPPGGMPPPPR